MNSLYIVSILCWVAMLIAFHTGHPLGYTIGILGIAASAAIADELSSLRQNRNGDRESGGIRTLRQVKPSGPKPAGSALSKAA